MSQIEIRQAALSLPHQARAELAQALFESLEPPKTTSGVADWIGIGASNAELSIRDEEVLRAEWK